MTCEHGFIGACAECDGAGQQPEPEGAREADYDSTCPHGVHRYEHACVVCQQEPTPYERWLSERERE